MEDPRHSHSLPTSQNVHPEALRVQPKPAKLPRGREFHVPSSFAIIPVSGPTLIRLDRMGDDSVSPEAIRVAYDTDQGSLDEAAALVSIGNYVFLPVAGRYQIRNTFASGSTQDLVGTMWENIDPTFVLYFLNTIYPSFTVPTYNVVLAAGVAGRLDNVVIAGRHFRFRGHAYIVSNVGAGDLTVAFGVAATATLGHPLAPGATHIFGPGQVAGITLEGFSTAGTTVAVTESLR